jgi:predicted DNA-binding transcriptional regulator
MKQPGSGTTVGLADEDMRVYNYIIGKGGSMKFSEALRDLNMSREEIDKSIGRLREMQLLH